MISGSQSGARVAASGTPATRVRLMRRWNLMSASGMPASGSTRSTAPVWIALRGMPSKVGLVGILSDGKSALLLDGLQAEAAVGAGSRQDDANRPLPVFLRQRAQQEVEWQSGTVARFRSGQVQRATADGEIASRRNDVEMFALEPHAIAGLHHGHRGMMGQQLRPSCFHESGRDAAPG